MNHKPEPTFDTIKRTKDITWFTHKQIFDDLLIMAQTGTACYIRESAEGLAAIRDGALPFSVIKK